MTARSKSEKTALHWRRTKIIATFGPASADPDMIRKLIDAGVDVVRLNMSHGDHDGHRAMVRRVRKAARAAGRQVAILMDLCGPKIRVGRFQDDGIELKRGATVTVTTRQCLGEPGLISSQYRKLHKDAKPGERVLLDDGKLELKVVSISGSELECRVVHGGHLSNNKGMNLPDSDLSTPAFTDKDKEDARLAAELDVDFVALSFVRDRKDVERLNRFMAKLGKEIPVISKIERPEAVTQIDGILETSYGIMVARGDLGIELPAEQVPLIQADLVTRARQRGIPVIVATQMLESMITHSRPTRAEVGDVANAVQLSADAVMLSGETASGRYPLQAVQTMDRVAREIEKHQWRTRSFVTDPISDRGSKQHSVRESMANAAVELSRDLALEAVIIPTHTGTTARIVAAHRTLAPTVGVCSTEAVCRRMTVHWGLIPIHIAERKTEKWKELCAEIARHCHLGKVGHDVLLVSGFNDDPELNEPVLKILHV